MENNRINQRYNDIIVTVVTGLHRSVIYKPFYTNDLSRCRPEDIEYNLEHLRKRLDKSELMKRVFEGDHSYSKEAEELLLFTDNKTLENYEPRLEQLLDDINDLKLGVPGSNTYDGLSFEEKRYFNKKNIDSIIRFDGNAEMFGKTKEYKTLMELCKNLKSHAVAADQFLRNVSALYKDLDKILRQDQ